MANHEWRRKCDEGCTCGKHRARPCAPGCSCSRHSAEFKREICEPGCTCGRHRKQRCDPGCGCNRHKPSSRRYTDEQRAEALERKRARNREYTARLRAENPEYAARSREKNKLHGRRYHLKHKFGLTLEQWDELLIAQSGRCYLCSDGLKAFDIHIDHSHECCSGKKSCGQCIRGLACRWCNQGVGQFRDDPERMRRAADALEQAMARISTRA